MNNKLKISIITVTKNSEKYLDETIKSLDNQTYRNFEHIIIDGKSSDKTIDIINKNSNKISYWVSEQDNSLYDAMNKGIKKTTGDVIGILNSDDIFYPDALSIVNKYFSNYEDIDFLFGSVQKYKLMHGYYPKKLNGLSDFILLTQLVFIRRQAHLNLGLYDTQYKYSADYDLFYRMIVKKN